jgi:hypothetical protein
MRSAPQTQVSHPPVARLAEGRRAEKQIQTSRQHLVIGALLNNEATPEGITAALGWTLTDLAVAVNRWAPKLRDEGWITKQACTSLLARFALKADR